MKLEEIPFAFNTGLLVKEDYLELTLTKGLSNHLDTMHAGALFTLAETASGYFLAQQFKHLECQVVPLLRDSNMKFKKHATSTVTTTAKVSKEALDVFEKRLQTKSRSTITVEVSLRNDEKEVLVLANFTWFISLV